MTNYASVTECATRVLRAGPTMRVVCCVCGAWLRNSPCLPEQDGKISHGICPGNGPCRRKLMEPAP